LQEDISPNAFRQIKNPGKPGFVYLVEAAGIEVSHNMLKRNEKI